VTIGVSLSGALTPAGVAAPASSRSSSGSSTGSPAPAPTFITIRIRAGMSLHRGTTPLDDALLRREGVIRTTTSSSTTTCCSTRQLPARTSWRRSRSPRRWVPRSCTICAASTWRRARRSSGSRYLRPDGGYRAGVPCYVSSPGDSSIGMKHRRAGDARQSSARRTFRATSTRRRHVYSAKQGSGKSASDAGRLAENSSCRQSRRSRRSSA